MAGTVNDFMARFGGSGGMDDQEAVNYFDRFASTDPEDNDFDNDQFQDSSVEYLGQMNDDDFQQAARQAYENADPGQQQNLAGSLLGALTGRGVDPGGLAGMLGLGSANPRQMGPDDYARLANYTRAQHPDAMREVVREQPFLIKALGNPVVGSVLGLLASRMLRNRSR